MPLRYTSPSDSAGPLDVIERARRYLAKMPPAVSGQHGHDQTFSVACTLVQGFGLSVAEAGPLFAEYNTRCSPPWSEHDLAHKLSGVRSSRIRIFTKEYPSPFRFLKILSTNPLSLLRGVRLTSRNRLAPAGRTIPVGTRRGTIFPTRISSLLTKVFSGMKPSSPSLP